MYAEQDSSSLAQAAVRRLMNDFSWRLLSEEEFVSRCVSTLAEKPAMKPIQACQNVYSRVLYEACRDVNRQEQAYLELHYYLYRIARSRRWNVAEDATQGALLLIFEHIQACRNPETFLRFAQFKLLQAIKTMNRRLGREEEPLVDDLPRPPSETQIPFDDDTENLWNCIRQIWAAHPRARNQLRAVLWKYFDELSDEEIARRINKTPAQVQVLRSRGLEKLRRCMTERERLSSRRSSDHRSARSK